jgi:hypothetical protein
MMLRSALVAFLGLLPAMTSAGYAQRLAQPERATSPAEDITVSITAKAGGKTYEASGGGICQHAPDASIRGASASLWLVQFAGSGKGGLKQLNLTLWRPKDGDSDQLSFSLETKSGTHRIETGGPGESAGEGTVTILPSGPGGQLEVSGKEANGKPIHVTIDCSAFADIVADGG